MVVVAALKMKLMNELEWIQSYENKKWNFKNGKTNEWLLVKRDISSIAQW